MKSIDARILARSVVISLLSVGLFGCSHTLSGAKEDVSTASDKAATAARDAGTAVHNAATAVKELPKNVASAALVTPDVKTAIIRDPVLNDSNNLVNVASHDQVVHLTGHVQTESMKQRATEDTQTVIDKRHPGYQVSNELTVAPVK